MRVFLSYASRDRTWVERLADALRGQGLQPIDPAAIVSPGENWMLAAGKALDSADAVVLVLSRAAAQSPWLTHEVDYALGATRLKGRVIGVRRPGVKSADIPWVLSDLDLLEAGGSPSEVGKRIARRLRGKRAHAAS